MKGIILAGGSGTRLYPMTRVMTKQLQNIYDKPMIYYSLSYLMLGGIKDILLISTPEDLPNFEKLLGDGKNLGIKLTYKVQEKPTGLPEAFVIGEEFIGNNDVCLILGDNLFYGDMQYFRDAIGFHNQKKDGIAARVFAYSVSDPQNYGVVEFDKKTKKVNSIVEKPKEPKSNYAIPGLYLFDSTVSKRAKAVKPSPRGETEIVELILSYHRENKLGVEIIPRGIAWLDTGTPRNLLDAASYIGAIEERQGLKVACLEEVALRMGFINLDQYKMNLEKLPKSSYRTYLEKILNEFE
jgi:glucose-1-phosphate thymidylyltransferase